MKDAKNSEKLYGKLIKVISETNGLTLSDTLDILSYDCNNDSKDLCEYIDEFKKSLFEFQQNKIPISDLLNTPISEAFLKFFKNFPLHYHEEHIHLTGSLDPEFIYPRIKKLLEGPQKDIYEKKIKDVYGESSIPIRSVEDVESLITLKEGELFKKYLEILYLPKLILIDRDSHKEAAYHMAKKLFYKYNVGNIRLKFTLNRTSQMESESLPETQSLNEEDIVLGLYDGYKQFQQEEPAFQFILSPSFRKEEDFFDSKNFSSKEEHFNQQVEIILDLIKKYPFLSQVLSEIDTVGNEKDHYRKAHFMKMKAGLRKLQYNGFKIRSHHGETWKTLKKGVQSVDNAMNIWHIDTLEHGLSLGVNPNFYFHRFYQKVTKYNQSGTPITKDFKVYDELIDLNWHDLKIKEKILKGITLSEDEQISFIKTKFHTAREIEHYQHDILNRMINKKISLVALPSSNLKLTRHFPDFKDHPFSWWERKGVRLGIGTDNYITLNTNYIKELLMLLLSNADSLKITKLIIVATKEKRRPYISRLLWEMRKKAFSSKLN